MNLARLLLAVAALAAQPALHAQAQQASEPKAQAAQAPRQARVPGYLTFDGLKEEIGLSVRWLRAQQDPATGAYGDVQTTCNVLTVFAESPWNYRYEDGPFVARAVDHLLALQRPDGAICEPDASKLHARMQTSACIETLPFFLDVPGVREALEGCKRFTNLPHVNAPWVEALGEYDDKGILGLAEDTLITRTPEGWWENPLSRVRGTAVNADRLCGCYIVLAARQKQKQATAAVALPKPAAFDPALAQAATGRGRAFLLANAEDGRFGFPGRQDAGITAMALAALMTGPAPRDAAAPSAIDAGLDWLVSLQQPDGSIHQGELANYVTSASILALVRGGREKDRPVVARARAFLQKLQSDEEDGFDSGHQYYGGIGYGGDERPDLSNLQMALDALAEAGVEGSDPTMQKALSFLQRCQNRSESNDLVLVRGATTIKSGEDGGAAYGPGESKAGMQELEGGVQVPRSYGSMTYALLKSYLLAGLGKEDPRVQAAQKWISANYTLDVNPGFDVSSDPRAAYQGLFYYYQTLAHALNLCGEDTLTDSAGNAHAWRAELSARLIALQRQDGSWINENAERWYEGNPVLATAYALLALDEALAGSR